jgi:cellulose synthase operon protein C
MPHRESPKSRRGSGRSAGICGAGILLALVSVLPAAAKSSQEFMNNAQQFVAKGDLAAALIELRNAEREAPQDPSIHLRLAAIYLRMAKNPEAEREAKTAGTLGAQEPEYLPLQLNAMLRQRKYGDLLSGIPAGDRAPAVESQVREARAFAYMGIGDNDQALANLREAVRLDPDSPAPKLALARMLMATKGTPDADVLVDEVLAKDPHSARALGLKAEILQQNGDFDGALQKLNETLAIDPNNLMAHIDRAKLYLLRQDRTNADKDLDPILAVSPNYPVANYLRALELAQAKQYAKAEDILTKISPALPNLVEGFYLLGEMQYQTGQMEQAEDNLTKYVARVPNNTNAVRLLAAIALKRGAAPRAINYLTPLVQKGPPEVATLSLLGSAYMADGKPELAMAQFDAAAKLAPENLQVKTQLAVSEISTGEGNQGLALLENVYDSESGAAIAGPVLLLTELRLGHVDKAAEVAQALIAKDQANPVYQTLLGLVRFTQRDFKGAEAAFSAVVAQEPGFAPATQNLAKVYMATGRRDEAKKVFEALIARKPDDVTTLLALTDLAIGDRDWKSARDYIDRARTVAPNNPQPSIKLVDLYLLQKDNRNAQSIATELVALSPKNADVLDAQARTQLAAGDLAGAAATYHLAFDVAPNSAVIFNRYVGALVGAKDLNTARDVLSAALTRDPKNLALKGELIEIEAQIGGIDAGLAKAHEFAAQDPNNPAYDLASAELYEKAGRIPEAIALLEKTGGQQPPDVILLALARMHVSAGEPDKAEALLKARLEKEPSDTGVRVALADEYLQRKQYDQARQEYERIITAAPNLSTALNNLAWLYQQQGDVAKAREMAERAAAIAPQNAAIADTLGWIMMAQGDNGDAIKYLKLAGASSSDPDIRYHLAVALQRNGQSADAKALLESILGSGANFQSKPDAQKLLQDLIKG